MRLKKQPENSRAAFLPAAGPASRAEPRAGRFFPGKTGARGGARHGAGFRAAASQRAAFRLAIFLAKRSGFARRPAEGPKMEIASIAFLVETSVLGV